MWRYYGIQKTHPSYGKCCPLIAAQAQRRNSFEFIRALSPHLVFGWDAISCIQIALTRTHEALQRCPACVPLDLRVFCAKTRVTVLYFVLGEDEEARRDEVGFQNFKLSCWSEIDHTSCAMFFAYFAALCG